MTIVKDNGNAPPQHAALRGYIVTIYGLYGRNSGGWLSVSTLIRLMAVLDIEEPAIRSAISRLKRRGLLSPERRGRIAGYALSARGNEVLAEGDRRIFDRPRASLGDRWLLAVFSVPESERQKRYQIRSRLTWLGFGTVASGVWIAPANLLEETREVLARYELASFVDLFTSDFEEFEATTTDKIAAWWDLDRLQTLYDDFLNAYTPVLRFWRRRKGSDADAFRDYVDALTSWRRLPYLDPGLPAEIMPEDWHGARAEELFNSLRERLVPAAERHATLIIGAPSGDAGQMTASARGSTRARRVG